MKHILIAVNMIVVLQLTAHSSEPRVISVGEKPESVCRGFDDKLFVSIIDGDEPGDGGVNVVDGDSVKEFCRGMNSPKGIVFVGGVLVTADETTIWQVNAKGEIQAIVTREDFPGPIEFLNDVAVTPDGTGVYVTEMSHPRWMFDPDGERKLWPADSTRAKCPKTGCVYRVGLDGTVTQVVPPGGKLTGPNGVAVAGTGDRDRIVLGDFFTGNILSWDGQQHTIMADGMRGADGIEFGQGVMYVSSWPLGKVWKYDYRKQSLTVLSDRFTTAADLFFDRKNEQLIVPDMIEGTLTFLRTD
ncbi:MAG: hypothetical protein MK110_11355 [Fuerstiella sp.]|nr:hypothetical protein [Fuerstiella sp.]